MDKKTRSALDIIFQEAHVIDFDLSDWDKCVRLVAVAQQYAEEADGRFPVFEVEFVDVEKFSWESQHLRVAQEESSHHCQWTVFEYTADLADDIVRVDLPGVTPGPLVRIWCRDIRVVQLDNKLIDATNPRWNRPYAGLARPSIRELSRTLPRE